MRPVLVQRVNNHTARFANGFPRQLPLFKNLVSGLRPLPAPAASRNNLSRIFHASTSTRHRDSEEGNFARMDTIHMGRGLHCDLLKSAIVNGASCRALRQT